MSLTDQQLTAALATCLTDPVLVRDIWDSLPSPQRADLLQRARVAEAKKQFEVHVGPPRATKSREELEAAVVAIPVWKRFLIARVLRRRQWRVARAFNTVAAHAINTLGDYKLFEKARDIGDSEWAKLYGLR